MRLLLWDFVKRRAGRLLVWFPVLALAGMLYGATPHRWLSPVSGMWPMACFALNAVVGNDMRRGWARVAHALPLSRAEIGTALWAALLLPFPLMNALVTMLVVFPFVLTGDVRFSDLVLCWLSALALAGSLFHPESAFSVYRGSTPGFAVTVVRNKAVKTPKWSDYAPLVGLVTFFALFFRLPLTVERLDILGAAALSSGIVLAVVSYRNRHALAENLWRARDFMIALPEGKPKRRGALWTSYESLGPFGQTALGTLVFTFLVSVFVVLPVYHLDGQAEPGDTFSVLTLLLLVAVASFGAGRGSLRAYRLLPVSSFQLWSRIVGAHLLVLVALIPGTALILHFPCGDPWPLTLAILFLGIGMSLLARAMAIVSRHIIIVMLAVVAVWMITLTITSSVPFATAMPWQLPLLLTATGLLLAVTGLTSTYRIITRSSLAYRTRPTSDFDAMNWEVR